MEFLNSSKSGQLRKSKEIQEKTQQKRAPNTTRARETAGGARAQQDTTATRQNGKQTQPTGTRQRHTNSSEQQHQQHKRTARRATTRHKRHKRQQRKADTATRHRNAPRSPRTHARQPTPRTPADRAQTARASSIKETVFPRPVAEGPTRSWPRCVLTPSRSPLQRLPRAFRRSEVWIAGA